MTSNIALSLLFFRALQSVVVLLAIGAEADDIVWHIWNPIDDLYNIKSSNFILLLEVRNFVKMYVLSIEKCS